VYCSADVDPRSPSVWRRVVGWERKALGASRKSGSDIALREARDEYACDGCIRKIKLGVAPTQGVLA
jgi:hypothetical protein